MTRAQRWSSVTSFNSHSYVLWEILVSLCSAGGENEAQREKNHFPKITMKGWPQSLRACAVNSTVANKTPFLLFCLAPIKQNLVYGIYQKGPWLEVNERGPCPIVLEEWKTRIIMCIWISEDCLAGLLAGWLAGWVAGWLVDWLVGRLVSWFTGCLVVWLLA